jgi:hypothetical protein
VPWSIKTPAFRLTTCLKNGRETARMMGLGMAPLSRTGFERGSMRRPPASRAPAGLRGRGSA